MDEINILVTLDRNYIPYLNVMLSSLLHSNPDCSFDVYLLHSSLTEADTVSTVRALGNADKLILVNADEVRLEGAPTTSRYPKEIYYRFFAAKYLPESLNRVLYLDPDLIVNSSAKELYSIPMEGCYFAAASHTGPLLQKMNELRLGMEDKSPYINSGVMLMNLKKLRKGDIKATQGDTGHAQPDMVAEVYAHILDEDRKVNAQRIEAGFYARADLRGAGAGISLTNGAATGFGNCAAVASAAAKSGAYDPSEWAFEGECVLIISSCSEQSAGKNQKSVPIHLGSAEELGLPHGRELTI